MQLGYATDYYELLVTNTQKKNICEIQHKKIRSSVSKLNEKRKQEKCAELKLKYRD